MARDEIMFTLADKLMEAHALAAAANLRLVQYMLDMALLDLAKLILSGGSDEPATEQPILNARTRWPH